MNEIISVGQLNQNIKGLLESNPSFRNVFVRGEISNYKKHSSGHHYLTLKDDQGAISAVLFRGDAMRLRFALGNGMCVIGRGRVSSFPKTGQVQLYLADLMPDGAGMLHAEFERRKEMLAREGLFDEERKKPLPSYPERIALITSPTGAAVHDMLRILARRSPHTAVRIYPTAVQGANAGAQIADALARMNADVWAQVAIVGRGGGSLEDLWAFNEEITARAIADSAVPIISAVGHEPDVTIADYVADLRAPTPSGAAELAVPAREELLQQLEYCNERLARKMNFHTTVQQTKLQGLSRRLQARSPQMRLQEWRKQGVQLQQRLVQSAQVQLVRKQDKLAQNQQKLQGNLAQFTRAKQSDFAQSVARLDAMSPLKVLARGYATVQSKGKIVTQSHEVQAGQTVQIRLHQGEIEAQVTKVRE